MEAVPARTGAYWAGLPARQHLVQFYDEDYQILETLEGFVAAGLRQDQGVIVIATASHLHQLEQRLRASWLDPDRARYEHRYVPVLASECLDKFMSGKDLDEARFTSTMEQLLRQAGGGRTVRVFGELVAMLWTRGHVEATLRLEALWHGLCENGDVQLLCGYPKRLFTREGAEAMRAVCEAHSQVLPD